MSLIKGIKGRRHRRAMGKTPPQRPRWRNVGLCVFALAASAGLMAPAYYYPRACIAVLERLYGYIGVTGVVIVPLSAYIVCGLALLCRRVLAAPVSARQEIYESLTEHLSTAGVCNYLAGVCGTFYGVLQYLQDSTSATGLVNAVVSTLLPMATLFLSASCRECIRVAIERRLWNWSEAPCES